MTNKEIAKAFTRTAQLMELYDENPFKIKSYASAAFKIKKIDQPLEVLSITELEQVDGLGKSLAAKTRELCDTGIIQDLKVLLDKTPEGVVEMLDIKGIGPKKVKLLWDELGLESVGELLYACNENRLVELKGFGEKTQEQIRKSIEFKIANNGKFHYAAVEGLALEILTIIEKSGLCTKQSITGAIRRKCEIIEQLEYVAACESAERLSTALLQHPLFAPETYAAKGNTIQIHTIHEVPVNIETCSDSTFALRLFETTATEAHLLLLPTPPVAAESEEVIYKNVGLPYIIPELREGLQEVEWAKANKLPVPLEVTDLKGILHNHSTYSDGIHSLEEMATYCKALGYQYLGICDHSQSAFYANGLKPERVFQQHDEIAQLNQKLAPFKIFKGIESDILNDGKLDYEESVLKTFDFIVASVHSNLKMDEAKATHRIITAVENPYTTILGHPTGRLLLGRPGYPIDHQKVIDACAANGVVIELNAHPYRLDLDWRWIQYAVNKGVMISINPDAHNKEGFKDMYYGVCVGRKGGLTKEQTFNALSLEEIAAHFTKKANS